MKSKAQHIYINPVSDDGYRWIENIGTAWREVGNADDIARGIQHRGWFTDEFESEVFRGIVYRLPSRKGSPVYFVGYADPNNPDCARGEVRTDLDDDADAARAADSVAEQCAEREREYQSAWRLGQDFAGHLETVEAERTTRGELFAELRSIKGTLNAETPALCKLIKDRIRRTHANIKEAYEARRSIIRDSFLRGETLEAFADGAGITTEQAKALF
jgi:hypothetical protein